MQTGKLMCNKSEVAPGQHWPGVARLSLSISQLGLICIECNKWMQNTNKTLTCHNSPFVQPYLPRAQVIYCNALNANGSRMQLTERWKLCLLCRLLCYICTLNLIQAIICLLYVQCSWWMIPTGLTARTRSLIWRMCYFSGKSEGCKSGSGGCL